MEKTDPRPSNVKSRFYTLNCLHKLYICLYSERARRDYVGPLLCRYQAKIEAAAKAAPHAIHLAILLMQIPQPSASGEVPSRKHCVTVIHKGSMPDSQTVRFLKNMHLSELNFGCLHSLCLSSNSTLHGLKQNRETRSWCNRRHSLQPELCCTISKPWRASSAFVRHRTISKLENNL